MTTQEAINEAIARGHDAMERSKPPLLDRLREMGCDREPFTAAHADCICRLTNEAAGKIEILETETVELHTALRQALRQWKMYAEMEPDRDLSAEASPEAAMYREALALADRN